MAENIQQPDAVAEDGAEERDVPCRRPLAGLCISFVAGLIYGFDFLPPPLVLVCAAAALLVLVWLCAARKWSTPALHAVITATGAALASLTANPPAPDYLGRILERESQTVDLIATIRDQPELLDGVRWRFPVHVEGCRFTYDWLQTFGVVQVLVPATTNSLAPAYGQRRVFTGLLKRQKPDGNRPAFVLLARADPAPAGTGEHSKFYSWCLDQRARAAQILMLGLRESDFPRETAMMRALVLGERTTLDDATRDAFSRTGTLHVVAISGGHVAVLFVLLSQALRSLGVPRPRWFFFIAPILIIYVTLAGLPSSAVRACIMAILLSSAALFRRRTDVINVIAVSAFGILLVAPREVQQAGFILSFLLVLALVIFQSPLRRAIWNRLPSVLTNREPHDPDDEPPAHRRLIRWALDRFVGLFTATLAAWLVAEPLTALFFNLRSPVALFINLLIVPLASLILLCGALSLVIGGTIGGICPLAVEILNHAGRLLISAMIWLVDRASALPGAWQYVVTPSHLWIITYFTLLLLLFFTRRRIRAAAVILTSILIAWWTSDYFLNRRATLEWFRPGETPITLLDLPRENDILINTGDARAHRDLLAILRKRGMDRIHTLILTRPTGEALGGAQKLLEKIPVHEVWLPAWHGRSTITATLLEHCRQRGIPVRELHAGSAAPLPAGLRCEILHPQPGINYRSAAAAGLTLRIEHHGKTILLTGGTGPDYETELIRNNRGFRCDLLLTATGDRLPPGPPLLAAAAPRALVHAQTARTHTDETFTPLEAPAATHLNTIPRHHYWRTELPAPGIFQSLETTTRKLSNHWNSDAWLHGHVHEEEWR